MKVNSELEMRLEAVADSEGIGAVLGTLQHWAMQRVDTETDGMRRDVLRDTGAQTYMVIDRHRGTLLRERDAKAGPREDAS